MKDYKIVYPAVRRGFAMRPYEPTNVSMAKCPTIPVVCSLYYVHDKVRAIGVHNTKESTTEFEDIAMDFIKSRKLSNPANKFTGHLWIYENGDISFMRS